MHRKGLTKERDMKTETYKGRKLKVVKARGADFGYTRVTLNGTDMGKHLGDEDAALSWLRGSIDFADEVGVSSGRMGNEWYAPGTFDLCDEGHATEIGGECGHHWCVEQRAKAAPAIPARRRISIAPQPGDDVHAVSHLAAGSALARSLPLSVVAEATAAPVVDEQSPVVVEFIRKSLPEEPAMTTIPAHVTLTVPARLIRRGDEFALHRHTRIAYRDAYAHLYGSVGIPLEGGGVAYLPTEAEVIVSRPVRGAQCATA